MVDQRKEIQWLFSYLETDYGFSLSGFESNPKVATNFLAQYEGDDLYIVISKKLGKVRIRLSVDGQNWHDKDELLEAIEIRHDRYPTTDLGFWTGHVLQSQAEDLKQHLDLILTYLLNR